MSPKGRILLVTDGGARATQFVARVRALGYEVVATVAPEEVAALVRHHYVDVVVYASPTAADAVPGGHEARTPSIARIRADVAALHLPIVAVAPIADASSRAAAITAGADDYILESTDDVDLGLRLRSQVRLRQMDLELRSRVALMGGAVPSGSFESGGTVVVVDDDPLWRHVLTRRLEADAHSVIVAEDLASAVSALRVDPDVLIVDVMLPDGSGLDFIRQVRQERRGGHMPNTIVVSALGVSEGKLDALRFGADDYLVKPVDANELAARVQAQLRRSRANRVLRAEVESARRDATRDALTRLYNRRFFDEDVARRVRQTQVGEPGFSLAMIDIDRFKSVNDEYGHAVGDEVLAMVAACLVSAVREGDLVCRYGGEEFVVVLPATGLNDALVCVERLRASVEWLACPPLPPDLPTVSAGVAEWRDGEPVSDTILRADEAVYAAKRAGRNRVLPVRVASSASSGQGGGSRRAPRSAEDGE